MRIRRERLLHVQLHVSSSTTDQLIVLERSMLTDLSAEKSQAAVTIEFAKLPGDPPYWFFDGFNDHCQKGVYRPLKEFKR